MSIKTNEALRAEYLATKSAKRGVKTVSIKTNEALRAEYLATKSAKRGVKTVSIKSNTARTPPLRSPREEGLIGKPLFSGVGGGSPVRADLFPFGEFSPSHRWQR